MWLLTSLQQHIKVLVFSAAILAALFPLATRAQTLRGLEISPFLLELDVEKGGTISSQVDLTNRSTEPLVISASPRDFLPGEEGQPEFVPDDQINDKTFSLASWVTMNSPSQFTIAPQETVTVSFSVNPPTDAEQGTHYGALLFTFAGRSGEGGVTEVQQSVGTILLVYYGQARENGEGQLLTNQKLFFQADKVNFTTLFQNTGNVHVKPKGEVYIKNIFGQVIATPSINRDASNVLPRTNRGYISTWYPSSLSFGPYVAESKIIYGRNRLETNDKVIIWVLPWYLLIPFVALIIFVLWLIFHGRHLHKRRVIRRHLEKNKNV